MDIRTNHTRTSLATTGFDNLGSIHLDLTAAHLYEHAVFLGEASVAAHGALVVHPQPASALPSAPTSAPTLMPADRFIVDEPSTSTMIAWNADEQALNGTLGSAWNSTMNSTMNSTTSNNKMDATSFARLKARVAAYLQSRDVYVQECYGGSSPKYRLGLRVVTEHAWQSLFARNVFVAPDEQDLKHPVPFEARFTVVCVPNFRAVPALDGTPTSAFAAIDFAQGVVIIGGTNDASEMQTAVFRVMNLLMPSRRVFPVHCAASVGKGGDSVLFLGLPGAGKTTLSADLERRIVGDSDHGWADEGVFNFAGGYSSKTLNITADTHPAITQMTRTFGTLLENTPFDAASRTITLDSTSGARASYPRESLRLAGDTIVPANKAPHARHVVFLTCDASGVLPPIARLTHEQAAYHFLSGYSCVPTSVSTSEPSYEAAFGPCFGGNALALSPVAYAQMLRERLRKNRTVVWLINTGWTGGSAETLNTASLGSTPTKLGTRIKVEHTRTLLKAALSGELEKMPFVNEPAFAMSIPTALPKQAESVPLDLLDPRKSWGDNKKYDAQAQALLARFRANFEQFAASVEPSVLHSMTLQTDPKAASQANAGKAKGQQPQDQSGDAPETTEAPTAAKGKKGKNDKKGASAKQSTKTSAKPDAKPDAKLDSAEIETVNADTEVSTEAASELATAAAPAKATRGKRGGKISKTSAKAATKTKQSAQLANAGAEPDAESLGAADQSKNREQINAFVAGADDDSDSNDGSDDGDDAGTDAGTDAEGTSAENGTNTGGAAKKFKRGRRGKRGGKR
jgi:phosphoenolpyruvate carboxykinase (ATP)